MLNEKLILESIFKEVTTCSMKTKTFYSTTLLDLCTVFWIFIFFFYKRKKSLLTELVIKIFKKWIIEILEHS